MGAGGVCIAFKKQYSQYHACSQVDATTAIFVDELERLLAQHRNWNILYFGLIIEIKLWRLYQYAYTVFL